MTKTEEKESCKACNHEICKVCKDCHNEYCDLSNKEPTKACYDQLLPKNESMPQQNWKEEFIKDFPHDTLGYYADHNSPSTHHPETGECLQCPIKCSYTENIILRIEKLLAQQRKEIEEWSKELIGKHNARILNEFQKQGTAEMPLIAYDERICLIPAITIAMEETDSDIITKLSE